MKYIKTYEYLDFKKYVIFYGTAWASKTIYMVKFDKLKNNDFYYSSYWYVDDTGDIDSGNDSWYSWHYNIDNLIILYQTDNFNDGLEKLKLITSTNKYNV